MISSTSKWLTVALVLCVATLGSAQQANTPNATQQINGVETGSGPMSAIADPCNGLSLFLSSGSNPSMPFSLFSGPVLPNGIPLGATGTVDLDFTSPTFGAVMDGLFMAGGSPVLNAIAQTDLGGAFTFNGAVGFGAANVSVGFQTLMTDPGNPTGAQLTAATNVTIISGAQGGTLNPPADGAVTHPFALGFTFTFYGTSFTEVHISDNAVMGFGTLADLQAMVAVPAGATQPTTNSTSILGTATAAPATIGFFEDLNIAANGGAGSIIFSESADQFSVSWCDVAVTQGGGNVTLTVTLFGDAHPTNPGRIEMTVSQAAVNTIGNGRVWGISPGGNGTTSNSPTAMGVNASAESRNIVAGGANNGFVAANAMDAIYESFNFAWGADPINPVFDFTNVTMQFDGASPGTGPYTLRATNEAPLSITATNPISSSVPGGGSITITGSGFRNDGTTTATLGTANVFPLTYVNSETLTGTIPAAPGGTPATVNVAVNVASLPGAATLMNGFSWSLGPLNGSLALSDEEIVTYNFDPNIFSNFTLYGTAWTNIHVQANGHAFMAAAQPGVGAANFVSDPPTFNGFADVTIAPLFNDLCHAGCSGSPNTTDVTTVETATTLTITWNGWSHWPTTGGPLTFSLVLDKSVVPFERVIFDYSASPANPNPNISQPGGASGIIVGMKPAGPTAPAPIDFVAANTSGASQGAGAGMFHWEASVPGYVGGVPSSGGTSTWDFGSAVGPGITGTNTMITFTPVDTGTNSDFIITLN